MSILEPGDVIDRYVVESILGQGGMAVVYRVRHRQLGTVHALKVLTVPDANVRERLILEGRIQASIVHPNIVRVHNVVESQGQLGLLMEYVEGPSLGELLEVYQPTIPEALSLFGGVLRAVHAAHQQDLAHRDLKPANVLLQFREDGVYPLVTDFGIAKVMGADDANAGGTTRVGAAMGTPEYMAPEQIHDASSADERADLWSLGVILYELLSGERPFGQERVLDILNAVNKGDYRPLEKVVPGIDKNLLAAVEACLEVDRGRRIGDTRVLAAILKGKQVVRPIDELFENRVPLDGGLYWRCRQLRHDTPVPVPAREVYNTDQSIDFNFATGPLSTLPPDAGAEGTATDQRSLSNNRATKVVAGGLAVSLGFMLFLLGGVAIGLMLVSLWPGSIGFGAGGASESADAVSVAELDQLVEGSAEVVAPEIEPAVEPESSAPVARDVAVAEAAAVEEEAGPEPLQSVIVRRTLSRAATAGTVKIEGDASKVTLIGRSGPVAAGSVQPGRYRVQATFDGESMEAGEFVIATGEVVTIKCAAAWYQCKVLR